MLLWIYKGIHMTNINFRNHSHVLQVLSSIISETNYLRSLIAAHYPELSPKTYDLLQAEETYINIEKEVLALARKET